MKKIVLDTDEKALLDSYERGEWQPVANRRAEIARLQESAREALKKTRRINIRVSARVLEAIQIRAIEEGLPYQTLIASILHRYITGGLLEKRRG
jgi:predicted DNA binding CopG/RHH family protein